MATTFVDAVRACLRDGGWLEATNQREAGGSFLVGVSGLLYGVHSDFQIARTNDGYDAIGCGDAMALGALYATPDLGPEERIELALSAASHHSAGVAPPFTVASTGLAP